MDNPAATLAGGVTAPTASLNPGSNYAQYIPDIIQGTTCGSREHAMRVCFIMAALLCTSMAPAQAAPRSDALRAAQFERLPNWTGLWISSAWKLGISGRPVGDEKELRANLQLLKAPPYNSEWNRRYETGIRDTAMMTQRNATLKVCTRSFPALMEAAWQFQIATLPEETLLVFENGQVRHIYTDGRPHPSGDDIWPAALGDSVGHWEGDTLVIETIARDSSEPLTPRAWVSILSDGARFTERLRRTDTNTMEDQLQIDDPTTLTHPWTLTLRFTLVTEMNRMIPTNCVENDRNPVIDGKILLTTPP
jgi:hypothetical protein